MRSELAKRVVHCRQTTLLPRAGQVGVGHQAHYAQAAQPVPRALQEFHRKFLHPPRRLRQVTKMPGTPSMQQPGRLLG